MSNILRWEGIVIDPIGASLAVLVYEFIISGGGQGALERALKYSRTREQFGAPLVEKDGFLAKVLVAAVLRPMPTHAQCSSPCFRLTRSVQW